MGELVVVHVQINEQRVVEGRLSDAVLHNPESRALQFDDLPEDVSLLTRHRRLFPQVTEWTEWEATTGNVVEGGRFASLPPLAKTTPSDDVLNDLVAMHVQINAEKAATAGSTDIVLDNPGPCSLVLEGLPPHGSYWARHRMVYPMVTRWTPWSLSGGESVDGRRFDLALRLADTGEWILPQILPAVDDIAPWNDNTRPPPPTSLWVGRDVQSDPEVRLWWQWREIDHYLVDGYRVYRAEGLQSMVDDTNEVLGEIGIRLVHEERSMPDPQTPMWTDFTAVPNTSYTYSVVSLRRGNTMSEDRISTAIVASAPALPDR